MKKGINSPIIALMAQMIAASSYGNSPYMSEEEYRKRKKANMKRIAELNKKRYGEKPLSKFVINGHEIEAYSRKDAITKLKHRGLL